MMQSPSTVRVPSQPPTAIVSTTPTDDDDDGTESEEQHQQTEDTCPLCDSEMVREDYVKYCTECYYAPTYESSTENSNPWREWWDHRSATYSGFYGPERIRAVGGFPDVYEF